MPGQRDFDADFESDEDGNVYPVRRSRQRQGQQTQRGDQGRALARRSPPLRVVPDAIYEAGTAPIERRQSRAPARRTGALERRQRTPLPARQKLRRALTAGIGAAAATLVPGGAVPDELKAAAGGAAGALADRLLGLLVPEQSRLEGEDDSRDDY